MRCGEGFAVRLGGGGGGGTFLLTRAWGMRIMRPLGGPTMQTVMLRASRSSMRPMSAWWVERGEVGGAEQLGNGGRRKKRAEGEGRGKG